ncbi:heavy-metal-associated domain-containing protein [Clostridium sporogenes]|uniref:Heavy-metal-associated domain-containing protein n=1 Tax=Clostridium sporogenes TaxID=1509 RepID=A0AAE4FLF3_CLOSG|nr:heavy-metal-associated domain-containing protein [Clostridium sporogenes]MDS1003425.1 heavy-metal-associated domain-containing protein [Clostridium sporogenes]
MNNLHLNLSGMANNESKTRLLNALDKVKGVQEVAIDLARGTVEVGYNKPANEINIKDCIEHTGYKII